MSPRTSYRTHRSRLARLTSRSPRASRLSRSTYVENIIVRNIQLVALPKQPDILQLRAEDSKRSCSCSLERAGILTTAPRCHGMLVPSRHRSGRVTNQHKLRLAADESYLAASLKVPPPKKKIVRSEDASQRLIRDRQREGVTLRLRPRPARV
jgi:hypothetical protein